MTPHLVICPKCNGAKTSVAFHNTGADSSKHYASEYNCPTCNGEGTVTKEALAALEKQKALGKQLRSLRIERDLSLRDFANEIGVSIPVLSKAELGQFPVDKHLDVGCIIYDTVAQREVEIISIDENPHYPMCKFVGSDTTYKARSDQLYPAASLSHSSMGYDEHSFTLNIKWELSEEATHWSTQCQTLVKEFHGCVFKLSKYKPNHWLLTGYLAKDLTDTEQFIARPNSGEQK